MSALNISQMIIYVHYYFKYFIYTIYSINPCHHNCRGLLTNARPANDRPHRGQPEATWGSCGGHVGQLIHSFSPCKLWIYENYRVDWVFNFEQLCAIKSDATEGPSRARRLRPMNQTCMLYELLYDSHNIMRTSIYINIISRKHIWIIIYDICT